MYVGLLSYDLDDYISGGQTPSDTEALITLNQAKDTISKAIFQYDPSITFTVTDGTSTYSLRDSTVFSRNVIRPQECWINGTLLRASLIDKTGFWSIGEFQRRYPSFRTDPSAVPFIGVYVGNQSIIIYPTPVAGTAALGGNFISGQYLAADMTTANEATTEPDIPNEIRPAIAYLGAIIAAEPSVSEQEQMARLAAYDKRVMGKIEEIAAENRNAQLDIVMFGNRAPEWIWG